MLEERRPGRISRVHWDKAAEGYRGPLPQLRRATRCLTDMASDPYERDLDAGGGAVMYDSWRDNDVRPNYPEDEPMTRFEAVCLVLVLLGSGLLVFGAVMIAIGFFK